MNVLDADSRKSSPIQPSGVSAFHWRYLFIVITHSDPDYALRWPHQIFRAEAEALLRDDPKEKTSAAVEWREGAEWLLVEAFASETPKVEFGRTEGVIAGREFLIALKDRSHKLPKANPPKQYYLSRLRAKPAAFGGTDEAKRQMERSERERKQKDLQRAWLSMVQALQGSGYLGQVAAGYCEDTHDGHYHPDAEIEKIISDLTGLSVWYPALAQFDGMAIDSESWSEPIFYTLVEVFHDLVARPRRRWYHTWNDCGWHYENFAQNPAQMLYRWRVNKLFTEAGNPLQIAKTGEDVGRLVEGTDQERQELIASALRTNDTERRNTVEHAVALFRGRDAGREEKRSACIALAALLEERRDLMKQELLSKDEGALFTLANQFDIRHRRADQKGDYDDAYLEWVYWWYLATVDLVEKLLARQAL
ncbi:hypothetical protein O4214_30605 [Rhodococcus erythropolis]|uniref:hypothetical protein n=1 Tax=Rhodococcus erythropolis TaxID=1833 RepID=UPI001E374998|nr:MULTISPECIES: hypothetical protein [Rhodococcus erythropolis group]MCD2104887.1 hypothetical protein [Rhodococcus qingshengii]MCZ4528341.1 hypothetical protein [Rhodococcus erythropolis]